jgi:Icc protein
MTTDLPLSILQITDLHLLSESGKKMCGVDTEQSFCQLLDYVFTQHTAFDLIIVTGDLAQTPCQFSYQRIAQELEKYQTKTVCLPGNHDDFALMQQLIQSDTVNCDKLTQLKQWQIICLNSQKQGSEGGFLDQVELEYLKFSLAQNSNLNTLIAVHHNSLPTHSRWLDTMMIENSDELFSILSHYPQVKAMTCGHIHQTQESVKNNILILGTPSTCFQFKPHQAEYAIDNKTPAYRTLQLYPDGTLNSEVYHLPSNLAR